MATEDDPSNVPRGESNPPAPAPTRLTRGENLLGSRVEGSGGARESGAAPEMGEDSAAPEMGEDSLAGDPLVTLQRALAGDPLVQQGGLPAERVGVLLVPAGDPQVVRQTLTSIPAADSAKLDPQSVRDAHWAVGRAGRAAAEC